MCLSVSSSTLSLDLDQPPDDVVGGYHDLLRRARAEAVRRGRRHCLPRKDHVIPIFADLISHRGRPHANEPSSARRISRTVSGSEDNIEARRSFVPGRSPASAKAGDRIKSRRAIVRNQVPASKMNQQLGAIQRRTLDAERQALTTKQREWHEDSVGSSRTTSFIVTSTRSSSPVRLVRKRGFAWRARFGRSSSSPRPTGERSLFPRKGHLPR